MWSNFWITHNLSFLKHFIMIDDSKAHKALCFLLISNFKRTEISNAHVNFIHFNLPCWRVFSWQFNKILKMQSNSKPLQKASLAKMCCVLFISLISSNTFYELFDIKSKKARLISFFNETLVRMCRQIFISLWEMLMTKVISLQEFITEFSLHKSLTFCICI